MAVYKFLHSRHVTSMMNGNVIIRPLSFYRRLEEKGERAWIGDRLENRSEIYIDHLTDETPGGLLDHSAPAGAIMPISPFPGAKNWEIKDVRFTYEAAGDPWVFCASDGDRDVLAEVMCAGSDGYDACVRIKDFAKFTQHLYFQGTIRLKPVSNFFSARHADRVKYAPVALKIQEGRPPEPGPFLKDIKFSSQREGRYALLPRNPIGENILSIHFPSPSHFLVREF